MRSLLNWTLHWLSSAAAVVIGKLDVELSDSAVYTATLADSAVYTVTLSDTTRD